MLFEAEAHPLRQQREDEERHGGTYAACYYAVAPAPSVRRCTAAAPAVRRHCDASEPARWCAGATPVACRPAPFQCRLKVFSQATAMLPLRRHDVGSRLSLNMKPGADGHPGGSWPCRPAVASTGDPPQRCSVLLQTGPRHLARGPLALAPRTSRRTTTPLRAPRPVLLLRKGVWFPSADDDGGRGASPTQSQRICLMLPKHMTALRQGVAPRAPEVILDDAIQAHLGRRRLRRL